MASMDSVIESAPATITASASPSSSMSCPSASAYPAALQALAIVVTSAPGTARRTAPPKCSASGRMGQPSTAYVLSIEHEDSLLSPEEGLTKAADFLNRIILREPPAAPWWV